MPAPVGGAPWDAYQAGLLCQRLCLRARRRLDPRGTGTSKNAATKKSVTSTVRTALGRWRVTQGMLDSPGVAPAQECGRRTGLRSHVTEAMATCFPTVAGGGAAGPSGDQATVRAAGSLGRLRPRYDGHDESSCRGESRPAARRFRPKHAQRHGHGRGACAGFRPGPRIRGRPGSTQRRRGYLRGGPSTSARHLHVCA